MKEVEQRCCDKLTAARDALLDTQMLALSAESPLRHYIESAAGLVGTIRAEVYTRGLRCN